MQKERRKQIEEMLAAESFVSIEKLKETFPDISEMTLRRDIEYFEREGLALKVRGGCRSTSYFGPSDSFYDNDRIIENAAIKMAIAKTSIGFLETGRSVFVDSGSTLRCFASLVPAEKYSMTTTDPAIALELIKKGTAAVNIVGGRLDREHLTVTGLQATKFLENINLDIAFLSPAGFSKEAGFTVGSYNECELKRIVVEKARKVIILMDSTKYDKQLPYTFCSLSDVDVLITDSLDQSVLDNLKSLVSESKCEIVLTN